MSNANIHIAAQPRQPTSGYISGGGGAYVLTVNSAPAARTIDLFIRSTRQWIRSTVSTPSGIFQFDGLTLGTAHDVIARDDAGIYSDAIVPNVLPASY